MKLKGKALLGLLIVLTLLLQLFTVSAAATYGESLSLEVSATDGADLGGGFVTVGGSMAALMSDGLSIAPPSGYRVQSAWIEGGDGANGNPLPLSADPNGSTTVGMSGEAFVDHSGYEPLFNDALLSSLGGAYTLHVQLAPIDPAAPVEISDAWGNISTGSVTLPGDPGSDGSSRFVGWQLDYGSNITALVQPGMTVYPYASCRYEAAYAAVVTAQPQAMSINAGDPVGYVQVDTFNLPYNMQVMNGEGYCQDGDYPAADSTLCVSPNAYLAYTDGSVVPADVAVLVTGTAPLTVIAAPVHTHTPGEAVRENEIPATCEAGGSYDAVVRCIECGEEISRETVYSDPLGHNWGDWVVTVPATETAEGVETRTCYNDPNHVETRAIPVIEHTHTPGEAVRENEVPATCETAGSYDEVVRCSSCGEELSRETRTTDPIGHNWGDWTVTKAATEAEEGEEARTCLNDPSHVEKRAIPKLDHVHTPVMTAAVPAGCETDGAEAYWTCSGCGKLFADEACTQEIAAPVVIPATGHNWGEWKVTKEATENEDGSETRSCLNDPNHTETRAIPALGHTHKLVKIPAVAATCEKAGNIEYFECSGCGKLFKDADATQEISLEQTVVPATGHNWGEWKVTKEATETAEGVETRTCLNDSKHTETRPIPKKGHTHKLTKVAATAATYEKDGNIEYYSCSGCGKLYKDAAATQEITLEQTVIPKLAVKGVTVTVGDQNWIVGSGTTLDQTRYTAVGFDQGDKYTVTLSAVGYTGGAGEYQIIAELSGYDTAKYRVTVIPGKLKVASPVVYPFLDSVNGYQWSQGSTTGLTLKVNADIRNFVGVKVDGVQLPENNYIVSSGSTVVTLKPEYLKNLTPANHAISIEFTDGSAATTFVVSQPPVVTPIPLTITGRNVSKAYDGNPYNLSSYGQNTQGITTQFHLAQNGQPVAQAVNPGSYDIYLDSLTFASTPANGYSITIIDSSGQIVATNYQNQSVRIGTLTITGANVTNVTVTVNDQAWTYDGTAHTPNAVGYTVSGLQGNDTITVKLSVVDASGRTLSAVTDAGTYSIKADCTGYDSSRYNVTVAKTGTLTVSPYKLTLTAESAVKNYDGSALRNSNVKATALLSGHRFRANDGVKFSVYDSLGNLIQNGPVAVGTYTKKVTDVHIVDSNNIEVTSNYDITRIDGTLTINNSDGSPKTGDTNKLTLWIVLLAVSALLILAVATLFLRRGRKGKAGKKQAPKADARPADKK